jgi:hypothetical protein
MGISVQPNAVTSQLDKLWASARLLQTNNGEV